MSEASATDAGCGCCQPESKSTQDVISELRARREDLDARLRRLERTREPVAAR